MDEEIRIEWMRSARSPSVLRTLHGSIHVSCLALILKRVQLKPLLGTTLSSVLGRLMLIVLFAVALRVSW